MAPSKRAVVSNVPEPTDLGRVGTRTHIQVGNVDTVNRHTCCIPRVDVTTQRGRLPAEGACTVIGEWSRNGR